jgi:hypothetical protein
MDDRSSKEEPAEISIQNEGPHKEIAELKVILKKIYTINSSPI